VILSIAGLTVALITANVIIMVLLNDLRIMREAWDADRKEMTRALLLKEDMVLEASTMLPNREHAISELEGKGPQPESLVY